MLSQEQYNIIEELLKNEIPVKMRWEEGRICYELEGFSKSGFVMLVPVNSKEDPNLLFVCKQRYNKESDIVDLRDIVFVNYCWWLDYKDREPFQNPDPIWLPLLIQFGFIKEEVETKKVYKPSN